MKIKVNKYWVVNLWEAIDGETVEINFDVSKYIGLDISNDEDRDIIIRELLLPTVNYFSIESREKIKYSLFYDSKYLSEEELLELLNFFGGTVFNTPLPSMTCRGVYIKIGEKLFDNFSFDELEFEEESDRNNYRLM
ncbi:MAG TPA: hypothetical protein VM802_20460 [Chitinophaga sp.]|uniref:hypothetical protein n=1 Tax=Chitinophaga sp. TaxID=1869181 RepID=UPI002BC496ED|nr:hypothetical protein [Chitinophaga sp.]HVI47262.1 hypothetical protein [Chitinophaga sp.]